MSSDMNAQRKSAFAVCMMLFDTPGVPVFQHFLSVESSPLFHYMLYMRFTVPAMHYENTYSNI